MARTLAIAIVVIPRAQSSHNTLFPAAKEGTCEVRISQCPISSRYYRSATFHDEVETVKPWDTINGTPRI
jgi:hypothetical protein